MEVRPLAPDAGAQPGGLNPADRSGPRFAFEDPRDAMAMLAGPHRSGKLALVLDA
jgi:hypothetical protein